MSESKPETSIKVGSYLYVVCVGSCKIIIIIMFTIWYQESTDVIILKHTNLISLNYFKHLYSQSQNLRSKLPTLKPNK